MATEPLPEYETHPSDCGCVYCERDQLREDKKRIVSALHDLLDQRTAERDQLRERLDRWEAWWTEGNGTLPGPYGEITLSPSEDSTP